jgi:hypothetical protein
MIHWKTFCQCCNKTPRATEGRQSPHSPYVSRTLVDFMENQTSLLCSQKATRNPNQSQFNLVTSFHTISLKISYSICLEPLTCPSKHPLPSAQILHAMPTLVHTVWSSRSYLLKGAKYKSTHFLQPPVTSFVSIGPNNHVKLSQTCSIYVAPSVTYEVPSTCT